MHERRFRSISLVCFAGLVLACGDDGGGAADPDSTGASTTSPGSSDGSSGSGSTGGPSSSDGGTSLADSGSESGTDTDTPPAYELGEVCSLDERVGELAIWTSEGVASLYGAVWDGPDPWIGPAELSNTGCAFHRFDPGACGACEVGEVCRFDGKCVAQRTALTDAELDVTVDGETQTIVANGVTGELFGTVGDGTAALALTLRFAGEEIALPPLGFGAAIPDLVVTGEGDSTTPLGLDATWTSRADDARVRTVIPVNHHAGGPTFTVCDVPAQAGSFHADAGMLQPLAVITGLEFQGLDVAQTAALHTAIGCVDVRLGVQIPPDVQWQ